MSYDHLAYLATGAIVIIIITYVLPKGSQSLVPLPPGPTPLPLVGNLRDLPSPDTEEWLHWLKFKDLYGPISTVHAFGQRLIIINEARLAVELLDKRSAIYSDRPSMPFAKLAGWGDGIALLEYGKRFHAYRKHMHREIGSKLSVARFNPVQETEVCRFLLQLIDRPQDLAGHVRKLAGAVILKIAYGYSIDYCSQDPLVDIAEEAVEQFSLAVRPGTWLVDLLPILKHIPAWVPGAGFQHTAQRFRKFSNALADVPFAFVRQQMQQPAFETSSYLSNLLQDSGIVPGSAEEVNIKWSAASLYGGGADTTVSTILSFFLTMALFPDVQKRAQDEIDRVVGRGRLPGYADRERLPYVDALSKEALRWHPIGPMGLPHRTTEDDIYNGYLIPKGSIVLPNIWGFCHDPTEYKDPMTFNPERFMGETPECDPRKFVFGYGRRICPGRLLADSNIFLTIAQTLAAFRIGKLIRNGREVPIKSQYSPGIISHPLPFEVSIELRDQVYEGIIRDVDKRHPRERNDAETLRQIIVDENNQA
ncbi:putative cytochrome P450 oxidoreductase OrdA-like protein [Aspergillus granulosus]|uniref:Cytochrome P450 oxidoreductase OrdA-like protein n=1 Tax=Aspergillus granulosus TaxID=176169 RepID=A0ABR4GVZ3_9EURO